MSTGNFQMELEGEGERAYGMSLVCIPVNSNTLWLVKVVTPTVEVVTP